MRLAGLEGESLEITSAAGVNEADPSNRGRLLSVTVQHHGFLGHTDAWILQEAWFAFLDGLAELERTRQGAASVEAIGPEELRLRFFSTDPAGHVAVDGFVGVRAASHQTKITFSPMAFDPTELPRLLHELKSLER